MRNYLLAFVPIFFALDALGMLPLFISLTQGVEAARIKKVIRISVMVSLVVSIGFVIIGRALFSWLGVDIADFMVAGGGILFILSLREILAFDKKDSIPAESMGVVPLAVPLMVGPAVMTTSLILLSQYGFLPTAFSLTANILLCALILSFSGDINRVIGELASQVLSKISHLLLAAIGVMLIRKGFTQVLAGLISQQ